MTTDRFDAELLQGEHWRITPITPRLVRLEWSPSGRFEDRPSVFALHRELRDETARVARTATGVRVESDGYVLDYDGGPFSANGLSLAVKGGVSNYHSVWRYQQDLSLPGHRTSRRQGRPTRSMDMNLGGATRTLDEADGAVDLDPGVNSVFGYAELDDSGSMVFDEAGQLVARDAEPGAIDLYVFAGGHDHIGAVRDLFALSGPQPLLPRFALGNWWSRYHRYDEDGYLALMDRFAQEQLPFSVAVIDMDWHLTDVDPKYGSGWTGYTWDPELFPDPARFQAALHERGMAVTLNVHPADGVRAFEELYPQVAEAMGREADGTAVDFDVTDPVFLRAYFEVLHRGLEKQGTDFWWIDWQSGPYSKVAGTDPLWVLNHGHFEDTREQSGQGLILSRYAGPGSHRYPVGFSGDTIISWESLAFQPRMTAAGANIGYGWWSHDIGGHMGGSWDDELAMRWVQFGVFSPIMRLHSSNSRFSGKEPWRFPEPARTVMSDHLRLRHRMLPYLHAMNHRAHHEGRCLVEPTYFVDPRPEAYSCQDQYQFGSQLLVAPIVAPKDPVTRRGAADAWLPEGRWTDVFTGISYRGGRTQRLHRADSSIPVLLRAGGVLPLVADGASLDVRETYPPLEVLVAGGADGSFTLPEEVEPGRWVETVFTVDAGAGELRIQLPQDAPAGRGTWELTLLGLAVGAGEGLECEGATLAEVVEADGRVRVRLDAADGAEAIVLRGPGLRTTGPGPVMSQVEDLIGGAAIGFALKDRLFAMVERDGAGAVSSLSSLGRFPEEFVPEAKEYGRPTPELISALTELLLADG